MPNLCRRSRLTPDNSNLNISTSISMVKSLILQPKKYHTYKVFICFKVERTYSSTVNLFKLIKDRVYSRKTTTKIINNQSSPGASDENSFVLSSLYGLDQIQHSIQKQSIKTRTDQFYKTILDKLYSNKTKNISTENLTTKKYLQVIKRISSII